ncbi:MAG: chromosome partitioning protein [Candidatus Nanopelagicales bacterium]
MSSIPVLLAGGGAAWEARLVASWGFGMPGLQLVRRCLDLADLLATASTGTAEVVVVDAELRRFDRESVTRLHECGAVVVAVVDDEPAERRVRDLRVDAVVSREVGFEQLATVLRVAVAASQGSDTKAATASAEDEPPGALPAGPGRDIDGTVVAVWGPVGAPGRTTIAMNLAAELAVVEAPVLLAEADTYGPCLAQLLGVLDEAPGLAAAARAANGGLLDVPRLHRFAPQALPGVQLLFGPTRSERWVELRRSSLDEVWRVSRRLAAWTVIDAGFCLEQDEALVYDTAAPQRNAATLSALEAADVVVVVAAGDPVGVARLVRALPAVREWATGSKLQIVVNRVRSAVMGSDAEAQLREALRRHTGLDVACFLPDDPKSLDAAVRSGRVLRESVPRSVVRQRLQSFARELTGRAAPSARRRRAS